MKNIKIYLEHKIPELFIEIYQDWRSNPVNKLTDVFSKKYNSLYSFEQLKVNKDELLLLAKALEELHDQDI